MNLQNLDPTVPQDVAYWDSEASRIWRQQVIPLIKIGFLKSIDRQGLIDYCLLAAIPSPDRTGAQGTAIAKYIAAYGLSPESRAKLKSLMPKEPKKSLAQLLDED